MHSKIVGLPILLAMLLTMSGPASAGVYSDSLGKCLVDSTSAKDRAELARWIFAIMAVNPQVKSLSNITSTERAEINRGAAAQIQRLLTDDCRKEAIEATRYEGDNAMESGFKTLGEVAMRGLMSDPAVKSEGEAFGAFLDTEKLSELGAEAAGQPSRK